MLTLLSISNTHGYRSGQYPSTPTFPTNQDSDGFIQLWIPLDVSVFFIQNNRFNKIERPFKLNPTLLTAPESFFLIGPPDLTEKLSLEKILSIIKENISEKPRIICQKIYEKYGKKNAFIILFLADQKKSKKQTERYASFASIPSNDYIEIDDYSDSDDEFVHIEIDNVRGYQYYDNTRRNGLCPTLQRILENIIEGIKNLNLNNVCK